MKQTLAFVARGVHDVITNPIIGVSNVTEWAKQQACWARVKAIEVDWPEAWLEELIGRDEEKAQKRTAVKDQRMLNGIEAQTMVVKAGGRFWAGLLDWGLNRKLLTETEIGILRTLSAMPAKIPSEKQCLRALETLHKLQLEGFQGASSTNMELCTGASLSG